MVVPKYPYFGVFSTEKPAVEPLYGGGQFMHRGVICMTFVCLCSRAGWRYSDTLRYSLSLYESPQGKDRANFRLADVQGEG